MPSKDKNSRKKEKKEQICEYLHSPKNGKRKEKLNSIVSNNEILPQCVAKLASEKKEWEHKRDDPNTCEEIQMQTLQFEVVVVAAVITLLVQGKVSYWVLQLLAL
jgi:hypothetical protein